MAISDENFRYVRDLVQQQSAISLGDTKAYLVESRLTALARQSRKPTVDQFIEHLRLTPFGSLHQRVVAAMTTNETSFFRDQAPFEVLREHLIPKLLERRTTTKRIYIWSAACASGQEPYSLGMLIDQHFAHLSDWSFHIIATDLSAAMLDQARTGVFSEVEMRRGLGSERIRRYFRKHKDGWQIDERIRRRVTFREMNLIAPWPVLPAFDVILLRNVMVYFEPAMRREILRQIKTVLRPDGFLILGGAETTYNVDDSFESVSRGGFSYYQLKS